MRVVACLQHKNCAGPVRSGTSACRTPRWRRSHDEPSYNVRARDRAALIIALVYPDPEKCGRGRPSQLSKLEGYCASRLSEARKIVKHSRDLAREVIAGITTFADALHFAEHPVEDEHVEPLPEPGDPVVLGTTSRRWSALHRSSHVTGLPDRTGPWWDNLDVEQLVTDILAADLRAPGFAHAVSDALLKKLGS